MNSNRQEEIIEFSNNDKLKFEIDKVQVLPYINRIYVIKENNELGIFVSAGINQFENLQNSTFIYIFDCKSLSIQSNWIKLLLKYSAKITSKNTGSITNLQFFKYKNEHYLLLFGLKNILEIYKHKKKYGKKIIETRFCIS